MNQPWSNLPNAPHIDWVLASIKKNPELWTEAWGAVSDAARRPAWDAASDEAWRAASDEAWRAASDEAWRAASDEAWRAARDAILALVSYDDCDQYLSMDYEKLQVYGILSNKPQAILLLPMVYVREQLQITNN